MSRARSVLLRTNYLAVMDYHFETAIPSLKLGLQAAIHYLSHVLIDVASSTITRLSTNVAITNEEHYVIMDILSELNHHAHRFAWYGDVHLWDRGFITNTKKEKCLEYTWHLDRLRGTTDEAQHLMVNGDLIEACTIMQVDLQRLLCRLYILIDEL